MVHCGRLARAPYGELMLLTGKGFDFAVHPTSTRSMGWSSVAADRPSPSLRSP
jgi:hypothetical protein